MIQQTDITVEQAFARLEKATGGKKNFRVEFELRRYPEFDVTEWEWVVYARIDRQDRDTCRSPLLRLAVEQIELCLRLDQPIADLMKVDAQIPKTQTLARIPRKQSGVKGRR
ncbi:MAG TPA: hypothetical protein VGR35_21985 [Tepidisphaeraceae bacterium]|nr:hypothetical protein [Tepidisphaeraceae bacterium]